MLLNLTRKVFEKDIDGFVGRVRLRKACTALEGVYGFGRRVQLWKALTCTAFCRLLGCSKSTDDQIRNGPRSCHLKKTHARGGKNDMTGLENEILDLGEDCTVALGTTLIT